MKTKLIFTALIGASLASNAQQPRLPEPYDTKSVKNYCEVIGWKANERPTAPTGFKVSRFATGLANPRNMFVAANGDIFVAEANTEIKGIKKVGAAVIGVTKSQNTGKSANRIILLRDKNGDGVPDLKTVFLSGLNQPFGVLVLGNWFYVANTDGLWRYAYRAGQTKITGPGKMIVRLPAGGYNNHWTRNLRANAAGTKIYIAVGSGTNVMEKGAAVEVRRANVLEINPDGSGERIYAGGLRNPCGIDFEPKTKVLWTVVNERDELGDDLVPDYFTSVKPGGFYGWPYSYFGQHVDDRVKPQRPDLVKKAIVPDMAVGPHTASLGLAFYNGTKFPKNYTGGAFIGQHGSWNRSVLSGYKVTYVPFVNGRPSGPMQDFLTGFIANADKQQVHGRPVGIAVAKDGALLVADDASNTIWRVSAM
jgi:glucose/arabinose dehydrogenase